MGIRMAELAVMWNVNGWSRALFPRFMLWARERFTNQLGNLNHSERFINDFLPDLVGIVHQRISGSLHTLVPALGIPSLSSRVIDIVSINGRSLLPTIHIHTAPSGKLQWFLLGCPCLEYYEKSAAVGAGFGGSESEVFFGHHKADKMVAAVHKIERQQLRLEPWRIVCIVGDQAIQGPGSTHFSACEAQLDGFTLKPSRRGSLQIPHRRWCWRPGGCQIPRGTNL